MQFLNKISRFFKKMKIAGFRLKISFQNKHIHEIYYTKKQNRQKGKIS